MVTLQKISATLYSSAVHSGRFIGTFFGYLGERSIQLMQTLSQKIASTESPQATGGLTVTGSAIYLYAIYRLSNFFFDVAKQDWHDGKMKKASLELAFSLAISILTISTFVSLIFALLTGIGGGT